MGEEKYSEKQQNKMKNQKRTISFLEKKEVEKIISSIKPEGSRNLRDRALITVLFSTGLRISEALALEWTDFEEQTGKTMELPIIGKGGWQRVIYFSPEALKAVSEYMKTRNDILDEQLLFPITSRCAQKMVIERAKAAGITKRVTPHVFRHSLATDLLKQGVDIRFVSEFLGHRSLNNTMIYTHIVNSQLKDIHKKLYK